MTAQAFVGRTYEPPPFEVTEDSIRDYMEAVGDLATFDPLVAPPTYAIVYGYDPCWQLWQDKEVGLDVGRLVHAEQSFTFHRLVTPGDRIHRRGRIGAIGSRGDLELVTFELSAHDAQDHPVTDGTALFVIRRT